MPRFPPPAADPTSATGFNVMYRPTREAAWVVVGWAATFDEAFKIEGRHQGTGHYWITPRPEAGK